MVVGVVVRKGTYRDSVTLMKISNSVAQLEGVSQAAVVMATSTNKRLLNDVQLLTAEIERAEANDLVIALEAQDHATVEIALSEVDRLLSARESIDVGDVRPKTLDSALRAMPDANLVMISVPGEYAHREAWRALRNGLNVFLFSSNVPLDKELELKTLAKEKGLLMMGPDCGTVIVNGTVLGFGNRVNPGSIGVVSASGTGLQQVSTLIDREGLGISQAIGTGGNDLSKRVGGIMMLEGIRRLDNDPKTQAIVLISKPPHPHVCERVLSAVDGCRKPVVVNFIGSENEAIAKRGYIVATTLEDAARTVSAVIHGRTHDPRMFTVPERRIRAAVDSESARLSRTQLYVRGLFSGGTLCYEAQVVLAPLVGGIYSNTPLQPEYQLPEENRSREHTCIDMGSETFTTGRLHPMIDLTLRKRRIIREATDPETAVILLDVMLGYGSHPDPATELVPSIVEAKTLAEHDERYLAVVASIIGTPNDPQDFPKQQRQLNDVGVNLLPSNAQAARLAALIATRGRAYERLVRRTG